MKLSIVLNKKSAQQKKKRLDEKINRDLLYEK
jgi:hypothetical protein